MVLGNLHKRMGTNTGSRSENLSGKKVHPILFFDKLTTINKEKKK
jgi:hypothetical protein